MDIAATLKLDDGRTLNVEVNEETKEVTVFVESEDGVSIQDIALVRPHPEKGYEALVWADAQDESYTHEFHILPTRF